jgi:hypothetical protein
MGRDAERDRDPDDWFDEPDTSAVRRGRTLAETDGLPPEPEVAPEDWLDDPALRTRAGAAPLPARIKLAVAAVVLLVLLIVGLLAGGVFDSGGSPATTPTTTPSTPGTTTRKTTTPTPAAAAVPVPTTPLAPGDEGPAVTELQRALERAGYPVGTIDGTYGPATENAVAQFQRSANLAPDGIAGTQTLAALNRKLNGS